MSSGGCSGLFSQTQGAAERELTDRQGKAGRAETAPGGRSWKGSGDTQRHRRGHVCPSHPRSGAWRCGAAPWPGQAAAGGIPEWCRAGGGRSSALPAGQPRPTQSSHRAAPSREGSGRAAHGTGGGVPNPTPPEKWGIGVLAQIRMLLWATVGSACGEWVSNTSGQEKRGERQEGMKPFTDSLRSGGVLSSLFWLCCFVLQEIGTIAGVDYSFP